MREQQDKVIAGLKSKVPVAPRVPVATAQELSTITTDILPLPLPDKGVLEHPPLSPPPESVTAPLPSPLTPHTDHNNFPPPPPKNGDVDMTDAQTHPTLYTKSQVQTSSESNSDPRSTISRRLILLEIESARVLSEYNIQAKATLEIYFRALGKERDRDGHFTGTEAKSSTGAKNLVFGHSFLVER